MRARASEVGEGVRVIRNSDEVELGDGMARDHELRRNAVKRTKRVRYRETVATCRAQSRRGCLISARLSLYTASLRALQAEEGAAMGCLPVEISLIWRT